MFRIPSLLTRGLQPYPLVIFAAAAISRVLEKEILYYVARTLVHCDIEYLYAFLHFEMSVPL